MKKLLSFALLFVSVKASAQIIPVQEVALSSGSIYTVAVASQPSVEVTSITANGKLYGAYAVEVYNLSGSTNSINCSFDQNVSTTSSSQYYGREIPAGVGVVWHFVQSTALKLFCMSQSVVGPTRVTVTQLK